MDAASDSSTLMHWGVASIADQVLHRIMAGMAVKLFVMDFKVGHCVASLASPATRGARLDSVCLRYRYACHISSMNVF
jgi:hypothetical protein